MSKLNVTEIAQESKGTDFNSFVNNFQNEITNIVQKNKIQNIKNDKEYQLDSDGYIIGNEWTETIASELIMSNEFVPTIERIEILINARAIFQQSTLPAKYEDIAIMLKLSPKDLLKMFPKFPIIYLTRWGNLRKPRNLKYLFDNPIKTKR